MIKRELYMKRIRPFIDTELIKVMTGIRRCGKSVMLSLIQEELVERYTCSLMKSRRLQIGKSASIPSG